MAQFPYYALNVQFFITKNDELSINTIRYIHEAKKIDMFSIFCFWRFGIFPHSDRYIFRNCPQEWLERGFRQKNWKFENRNFSFISGEVTRRFSKQKEDHEKISLDPKNEQWIVNVEESKSQSEVEMLEKMEKTGTFSFSSIRLSRAMG